VNPVPPVHPRVEPVETGPPSPTVEAIQRARTQLLGLVRETPAWQWSGHRLAALGPVNATVWLKLELCSTPARSRCAAPCWRCRRSTPAQRARGVTAMSGGNHAMAVAYAARQGVGTTRRS
jgi:threonine dehydratase